MGLTAYPPHVETPAAPAAPIVLEEGAVYRVKRDRGLTPLAVFTGSRTPSGRCRFRVIDPQFGESSRFACTEDQVVRKVAGSFEAWAKRGEQS